MNSLVEFGWGADHPAVADPALAPWAGGIIEIAARVTPQRVLRHLKGRRVATKVTLESGASGVLKVFARPRARGNDRRLHLLAAALGELVPVALGCDRAGHVSLVSWQDGIVFDELADQGYVDAAHAVGRALRSFHDAPVTLDREWGVAEELDQLQRRIPEELAALGNDIATAARAELVDCPLVPAHRDCHPRQIVIDHGGRAGWIDLDDAAMAPAGLDIGNFIAHVRKDAVVGQRDQSTANAAIDAFVAGYGTDVAHVEMWERLSLIRLAGLATTRHQRSDWQHAIVGLISQGASS